MTVLTWRATIEDLARVDGKAELVNGELVHLMASGGLPGFAAMRIVTSLDADLSLRAFGVALGDNVGYVVDLPNRRSFSPDAAFTNRPLTMRFIEGAPLFAVEVRSESDYGPAAEREMAEKRADYFAAGTLVVWDVDLLADDVVRSYRAGEAEPLIFRRGDLAHAEPALPGWSMAVDDLFPDDGR